MNGGQLWSATSGQQAAQPSHQLLTETAEGCARAPLLASPHKLGEPGATSEVRTQQQAGQEADDVTFFK